MKRTIMIFSVAALLLSVGCSKEKEPQKADELAVQFNADITTRVTDNADKASSWESGDAIGIYMKNAGEALSSSSINSAGGYGNMKYTTVGDGKFGADVSNTIYYPVAGTNVDFVAYYPYGTPANDLSVAYESLDDVLYSNNATNKNKFAENRNVDLVFNHMMSKVVVKLKAGNGGETMELATAKVVINNQQSKSTLTLVDGVLSGRSTKNDLVLTSSADGATHRSLLVPQGTDAERKIVITVKVDGKSVDFTYTSSDKLAGHKFESGKMTVYTITLDRVSLDDNNVTAKIEPWGDGGSDDGQAIPQ